MITEYVNKLFDIVENMRLLGKEFSGDRIIETIIIIYFLVIWNYNIIFREFNNMLSISLVELVNALQTFEQRKIMRDEGHVEGALLTKSLNRKRNMLGNKSEKSFTLSLL